MPEYSRIPKAARWHVIDYMRTLGEAGGPATDAAAADTTTGAAPADTATGGDR